MGWGKKIRGVLVVALLQNYSVVAWRSGQDEEKKIRSVLVVALLQNYSVVAWRSGQDEEKIRESSQISLASLAQRIAFAPSSLAAPAGRRG